MRTLALMLAVVRPRVPMRYVPGRSADASAECVRHDDARAPDDAKGEGRADDRPSR